MPESRTIYEDVLAKMSAATLARDASTWCAHLTTPHLMATSDGRVILETTEQKVRGLEAFADSLDDMGVVRILRECETAHMVDPNTIVGYHTTRLVRADGTSLPPYQSKWVLQKLGDIWRISKSESALSANDEGWTTLPHAGLAGYRSLSADQGAMRKAEAQLIMDRIDTIFVSGDYDGWRRSVDLPLTIAATTTAKVIATEAELAEDFAQCCQQYDIQRVSDITRLVASASMLGPDRMLCHYRVHVTSSGTYVVPPWDAAAILVRFDDSWRISTIKRALGHVTWLAAPDRGEP